MKLTLPSIGCQWLPFTRIHGHTNTKTNKDTNHFLQIPLLVLTVPSIGYQWSPFTRTTIRQSGAWGEGHVGAGAGPLNHRYVFMDVFHKYRYTNTKPRWFLIVGTAFGDVVITGS